MTRSLNSAVEILQGDVFERLRELPAESVDCVVTSPPYWGLRDYGVEGQIGLEPTLGQHLDTMVSVFAEVWRVLKPTGTVWLNYGDCYAATPNGKSAAAYNADGSDDRTFRDKPFSTIGAIYDPEYGTPRGSFMSGTRQRHHDHGGRIVGTEPAFVQQSGKGQNGRKGRSGNLGNGHVNSQEMPDGRVVAGGYLKPKDLCMLPNRLAIALQDAGWWVRSEIIWAKPNPMPESVTDRPATAHEKIFLLSKSGKYSYNAEAVRQGVSGNTNPRVGKHYRQPNAPDKIKSPNGQGFVRRAGETPKSAPENSRVRSKGSFNAALTKMYPTRNLRNYEPAPMEVWRICSAPFKGAHFATFPPELVERCLLAGCPPGGHVLDPFGGAGTTGMVARALGMTATLIELNEEYVTIARERLDGPPIERTADCGTLSLFGDDGEAA